MPSALLSRNVEDLTEIYQPEVNVCVIERSPAADLRKFVETFLAARLDVELSRAVGFECFDGHGLLPFAAAQMAGFDAWRCDVVTVLALFCDLFEAGRVGLRLRTLDKPMCPRFHTDFVPARLVCIYGGCGTEWLPEWAVDRSKLGSGAGGLSDEDSGLIRDATAIQSVPPSALGLLKGEKWEGNHGRGAVHRSPRTHSDQPCRLLLTLDLL